METLKKFEIPIDTNHSSILEGFSISPKYHDSTDCGLDLMTKPIDIQALCEVLNQDATEKGIDITFGVDKDNIGLVLNEIFKKKIVEGGPNVSEDQQRWLYEKQLQLSSKEISLFMKPNTWGSVWYNFKQHTFGFGMLRGCFEVSKNTALKSSMSSNSACMPTWGGIIASTFLISFGVSIIEGYIPAGPVKNVVKTTTFILSRPTSLIEHALNVIIQPLENLFFKENLPINVTKYFRMTDGPTLNQTKDFKEMAEKIYKYLKSKN
jgi:hypothetical protein